MAETSAGTGSKLWTGFKFAAKWGSIASIVGLTAAFMGNGGLSSETMAKLQSGDSLFNGIGDVVAEGYSDIWDGVQWVISKLAGGSAPDLIPDIQ